MTNIITPKKWIHSFDLWGVLVNANIAGEETIRIFQEIGRINGTHPALVASDATNYRSLLDGTFPKEKKGDYIAAVKNVTEPALKDPAIRERVNPNFDNIFYEDGIPTVQRILDFGEYACIFSTAPDVNVNGALSRRYPDLLKRMTSPFYGDKMKVQGFMNLAQKVGESGMSLATHTEDDVDPVNAALDGNQYSGKIVLVDRRGNAKQHKAYREDPRILLVNGLDHVDYRALVPR